jgi:hypothetical protein
MSRELFVIFCNFRGHFAMCASKTKRELKLLFAIVFIHLVLRG